MDGEWLFWLVAAGLTLGVTLIVVRGLTARETGAPDAPDVDVYKDQLRELDRDVARGTLTNAEAEAARAEVARRLLAADQSAQSIRPATPGRTALGAVIVALCVAAIGAVTYGCIGAPGYPDMPLAGRVATIEAARAERPGQAVAEAEVPNAPPPADAPAETVAMVEQLRDVLQNRPDDLRGWQLAASVEAGMNNLEAAWRAQDRVIAILGDAATAEGFAILAELMIQAAGGYVSPEAERALAEALRRDPTNGLARYYTGLMFAQGGRADRAWPIWRRLYSDSPADAPWLPTIAAQLERISQLAGDPTPLEDIPRATGPSQDQIEAAGDMTPEERMEMIGSMVQGLAERLASQGGPPGDWARLITAYGVLGRSDAAAAVYAEAQLVFQDAPAALDTLARAAERAGLAP
ncbi:c-type cytochrome biogenesis protein CcmI [Jannaschia aquimarina]|uniref:Cytochrome c-type biogenesis protein CcmH n=1 Tax=Jannaschia aquimarina TaxID=935700 RepID=A0A0D1EJK4_9RHOB|nr:c-type cytochrome biogenesis protein CcmI [Jannaschia aquimarina]KIT15975.1 hypothetical protein jaqu_22450 [Jannaschia aquimarina]SNS99086.1 cytochrome c-type biogenesis protein CcmH [Jannaschia aquimarina]